MPTLEQMMLELSPARRKKVLDRVVELIAEQKVDDKKKCKSKNPDVMCSDCDCWKHTRSMCS